MAIHQFSTESTMFILAVVVLYIILTSWLSVKLRSKTSEQFMNAAKAMPAVIVGFLLMTEFIGAKSTVGTAESAFEYGMAAAWSVLAAAVGYLLYGLFFVKRLYKSGEFTISGAIAQKFGRSTKMIVSIIMIAALLLVNVGNYISGAAALTRVMNINIPLAMLIIAIVSTFYYVLGGMKGVAYVTIIHAALKYIGVIIILAVALSLSGGITPVINSLPDYYFTFDGHIGGATIFAWVIATSGSIFSTQFVMQAISSTKSAKDAQKACFIAVGLCLPLGLILAAIGVIAHFLHPQMRALFALPVFIQQMGPILAAIVTTSIVAAVFVSVSTVALGIASLVVEDFYVPKFNPEPQKKLKMTRIISIIIGFLPLLFVFGVPEILKLSFFTRALRLTIAVVAVLGFYLPFFKSTCAANIGLVVAAVGTAVWYLLNNPFGIDNIYIALIVPAVVMTIERVMSKLFTNKDNQEETIVQHNKEILH
ncbi:sodium:solute symporter family protein [Pectinatus brassicae]|uniref:SSS family solute:Na+ symporter n=1 Tax=Pectinatus brassicae TaxID=862415 RepID=A0A840UX37_9FIRM|nr:sodium:solute symporter family protein [Pectinatus brassicae]MBB5336955.1 SSS family solute:Na+ symporter [Pectinatus brassicae]